MNDDQEIKFVPDDVLTELEKMEQSAVQEAMVAAALEPLQVENPMVQVPVRQVIPFSTKRPLYKFLLSGFMKPPGSGPRVSKFWYNGQLITKAEHDSLSMEVIREANDYLGRKFK